MPEWRPVVEGYFEAVMHSLQRLMRGWVIPALVLAVLPYKLHAFPVWL
jgi:hypothetical protein